MSAFFINLRTTHTPTPTHTHAHRRPKCGDIWTGHGSIDLKKQAYCTSELREALPLFFFGYGDSLGKAPYHLRRPFRFQLPCGQIYALSQSYPHFLVLRTICLGVFLGVWVRVGVCVCVCVSVVRRNSSRGGGSGGSGGGGRGGERREGGGGGGGGGVQIEKTPCVSAKRPALKNMVEGPLTMILGRGGALARNSILCKRTPNAKHHGTRDESRAGDYSVSVFPLVCFRLVPKSCWSVSSRHHAKRRRLGYVQTT